MKLRNKETGEIVSASNIVVGIGKNEKWYNTLAELSEEWEDYEEPKQSALRVMILTLANFIENEPSDNVDLEDCKDMLEKLEAWERLKEKEVKFEGWKRDERYCGDYTIKMTDQFTCDDKDLDLLFGGEDEI